MVSSILVGASCMYWNICWLGTLWYFVVPSGLVFFLQLLGPIRDLPLLRRNLSKARRSVAVKTKETSPENKILCIIDQKTMTLNLVSVFELQNLTIRCQLFLAASRRLFLSWWVVKSAAIWGPRYLACL